MVSWMGLFTGAFHKSLVFTGASCSSNTLSCACLLHGFEKLLGSNSPIKCTTCKI